MIVTGLPQQIAGLREQLTVAQQQLQASRLENALLRQKLDALARRYFGRKSEQLGGDQPIKSGFLSKDFCFLNKGK